MTPDSSAHPLNNRCALVVDDETDSREALVILLRWMGYDVHSAANGGEALQAAREFFAEAHFSRYRYAGAEWV